MGKLLRASAALVLGAQLVLLGACVSDDDAAAADGGAVDAATDGAPGDPAVVQTRYGPVKGRVEAAYRAFLNIPYGAPTGGARRWKAPEPPAPWSEPRDATEHGPSCWQPSYFDELTSYDEDCLSLAVWTPNPAPSKAPVMVWIHGGGFAVGGKAIDRWSGRRYAAERGVVVVSINYRLGVLAQLAHAALGDKMVNFGLLDQQAALRWVRDNIAAFGGDPDNVTLFGESAGGLSVCLHMVSPKSRGLFTRGISQSGPCIDLPTRAQAEAAGDLLAKAVGCDGVSDVEGCLRGKPAETLVTALELPFLLIYDDRLYPLPFVDGVTITEQPPETLKKGTFYKVPLLLGTNAHEGTLLISQFKDLDAARFESSLGNYFDAPAVSQMLARYAPSKFGDSVDEAFAALMTDSIFACPARRLARAAAQANQPVYLYQFVVEPALFLINPFLRSTHGAELQYVFGLPASALPIPAKEKPLVETMMGYWARFAKTGDPNGDGAVSWPRYAPSSDEHLQIGLEQRKGSALKKDSCDFWQSQPL